MDIACPGCGGIAEPAGHEDARAFFRCPSCDRVWATQISSEIQRRLPRTAHAPRVLVADDAPDMLGLTAAWLEDEGCVVIAVGTGREALDAATTYQPDVAILDIVLPPPDGFSLAEMFKARRGPAVVLMTGLTNPDRRRAATSGALAVLHKPFSREDLLEAVSLALEGTGRQAAVSPR